MPNAPTIGGSCDTRGDKTDRVQRACDRCNTSRTRCSGEQPCRRCFKLDYACHYDRTVKKRGPKPRTSKQQSCNPDKRSLNTAARRRATYPSPGSTSSGNSACRGKKTTPRIALDWDGDRTDSQSSGGTSDVNSSFDVPSTFSYVKRGTIPSQNVHTPTHSHFPLNLSSPAITSDHHDDGFPCRYPCLDSVLPLLKGTVTPDTACDLLDIFFADPHTTGPNGHCPYVLTPVIRRTSLLRQSNPRPISPALLTIILWCVSHTANLEIFKAPSARSRITQRLYFLSMKLLRARDCDQWHHARGGWIAESDMPLYGTTADADVSLASDKKPEQNVDDILSYVLLTCVVSGTEFKEECFKWWNKAVLLVKRLGLHSEARIAEHPPSSQQMSLSPQEDHEEHRRAFWLVYSLDRHLALSFNQPLHIHDSECQVLYPLPEWMWQNLDSIPLEDIPPRICGPPTQISGTGFFEYFLPLMAILGDIIELRSRNQHPRLGCFDEAYLAGTVEAMLADCEYSLEMLQAVRAPPHTDIPHDSVPLLSTSSTSFGYAATPYPPRRATDVVITYSQYIIRVLHMLLYRKSDTTSAVESNANCVLSPDVFTSTTHAVTVGESIAHILEIDKDLSFMPFVFGIYLFHGSLNFFSVVHQMARVGGDGMAQQGCEAIARAHEVAIKSLDTSFQRHFTRVVRQYSGMVGGLSSSNLRAHNGDIWGLKSEFRNTPYR
ncbi:fungal-specific transcription factor domain-containing protein [Aspergillus varians]